MIEFENLLMMARMKKLDLDFCKRKCTEKIKDKKSIIDIDDV